MTFIPIDSTPAWRKPDAAVYVAETPHEEEFPMTFGGLFFACNGWLMAIDRREFNNAGGFKNPELTTKILVEKDVGVAACWAGDLASLRIAESVIRAIRDSKSDLNNCLFADRQQIIETIAHEAILKTRSQFPPNELPEDAKRQVLVVLPFTEESDFGEAWLIQGCLTPLAHRKAHFRGARFIGDEQNPAVYFSQRYYAAVHELPLLPVKELEQLAAHVVLEAHFFNPTSVYGLDMLSYVRDKGAPGKYHLYKQHELDDIAKGSSERVEKIRNMF